MDNLAVFVILICSLAIFWSCVCRLTLTHREVLPRVRYRYAIMGTGSLFAAFGSYIFPSGLYGIAIFFVAMACGFWLDRKDWAHGVPESATIPGELNESKRPRSSVS